MLRALVEKIPHEGGFVFNPGVTIQKGAMRGHGRVLGWGGMGVAKKSKSGSTGGPRDGRSFSFS